MSVQYFEMRIRRAFLHAGLGAGILLVLQACASVQPREPDDTFGHRYDAGSDDDGYVTVQIHPARESRDYHFYPAIISEVRVRQEVFDPDVPVAEQAVPVEVLVKGSFPDTCTELHNLTQERIENIIRVKLEIRRPRRERCERVQRYYRHYFLLEGIYGTGHYSLYVNGRPYPFQVFPRVSSGSARTRSGSQSGERNGPTLLLQTVR